MRDFVSKVKDRASVKKAAGEESPLKLQREAAEQRVNAAIEQERIALEAEEAAG